MDGSVSFFTDLSIVIVVATFVGLVFSRFNLPLTVGYILAGVLVGPTVGPALIRNKENIQMLSDLGVMFLMFSIGLGFSFRRVRQMGSAVVFPAVWDVVFMVLGGFCLGKLLGWGNLECFLLGLILCDSSTSIAAKTLESLGWLGKRFADCTFAIALIEDVLAILLIAVLGGIGGGEAGSGDWTQTALVVGRQLGVLVLFLVGVTVFGILFVPKLMNRIAAKFGDEMVLMTALGICFGVSCLAQNGLGLSLVVGAFLAGAVIAESKERRKIEQTVRPVTNLFAAVFFVSVGLMMDPKIIWDNIGVVVLITFAMIALKWVNNASACLLVGERSRDAFKIGIGMGQVAEFSFIIAGIAMSRGMSERPLYQIAVGVALLCTATNPYLLRSSDKLYNWTVRLCAPLRLNEILQWYRRWTAELSTHLSSSGRTSAVEIRKQALFIGVDFSIVAIFFSGVYFLSRLTFVQTFLNRLNAEGWLPFGDYVPWGSMLCCVCALLLAVPPFYAAWRSWEKLGDIVANDAFSYVSIEEVRRTIRLVMRVIGWCGIFVYATVLCAIFATTLWVTVIAIALIAVITPFYSKYFTSRLAKSHELLTHAFDVNAIPVEPPDISSLSVHTRTVKITNHFLHDGKTLGELDLRHVSGASVISVNANFLPGRDTALHSNDVLVIAGSDAELERAEAILMRQKDA